MVGSLEVGSRSRAAAAASPEPPTRSCSVRSASDRRRRARRAPAPPSRGLRPAEGDRGGPSAPSCPRQAGGASPRRRVTAARPRPRRAPVLAIPQPSVRDHAHGRHLPTAAPSWPRSPTSSPSARTRSTSSPRWRTSVRGCRGGHLRGRADPERHPHRTRSHRRVGPHGRPCCRRRRPPQQPRHGRRPGRFELARLLEGDGELLGRWVRSSREMPGH